MSPQESYLGSMKLAPETEMSKAYKRVVEGCKKRIEEKYKGDQFADLVLTDEDSRKLNALFGIKNDCFELEEIGGVESAFVIRPIHHINRNWIDVKPYQCIEQAEIIGEESPFKIKARNLTTAEVSQLADIISRATVENYASHDLH